MDNINWQELFQQLFSIENTIFKNFNFLKNMNKENKFFPYPTPMAVVKKENWKVQEINLAFQYWTGYTLTELQQNKNEWSNIIYKKDLKNIFARLQHSDGTQHLEVNLRLMTKNNGAKEAEVFIQCLDAETLLFVFHDIQIHKEIERELRDKIAQEQNRTAETAKNLLRTYVLLKRLNQLPLFCYELENLTNNREFEKHIIELLCQENGLGYVSAAIFWIEGEHLQLSYSKGEYPLHRFHLNKNHKLSKLARGEKNILLENSGEIALPISFQNNIMGILHIKLCETECSFVEDKTLFQANADILQNIAQWIGLMKNRHQYTQLLEYSKNYDSVRKVYNFQSIARKIQEYITRNISFNMAILSFDNFYDFSKLPEERLQIFLQDFEKKLPPENILGSISPHELVIIWPEQTLSESIFLIQSWKNWFKNIFPEFNISLGLVPFTKDFNFHSGELWKFCRLALQKSRDQNGDKFYYWDTKNLKTQEIIERSGIKLE